MRRLLLRLLQGLVVWDEEVRASRDWLIALVVLLGLALALMFTIGDLRSR